MHGHLTALPVSSSSFFIYLTGVFPPKISWISNVILMFAFLENSDLKFSILGNHWTERKFLISRHYYHYYMEGRTSSLVESSGAVEMREKIRWSKRRKCFNHWRVKGWERYALHPSCSILYYISRENRRKCCTTLKEE